MMKRMILLALAVLLVLCGCSQTETATPTVEATQPPDKVYEIDVTQEISGKRLMISLENADELATQYISEELPDGVTDFTVTYHGVTNVTIDVDGNQLPLIDALKDRKITPEEIICYAQLDANDNFCFEYTESTNGMTKFVYHYYDLFDLVVLHDVYETPDGNQHLIKELHLCQYNAGQRISFGFGDLDNEDWGLTFEPADISASGLTLQITQEQGQHIGTLHILQYALVNQSTQKTITLSSGDVFVNLADQENNAITNDGVTEIVFDWSATHGELPAGAYKLVIYISDVYDESQVHPLMKNFEDAQFHHIEFSIP